jgi:hypothetical protein
MNVNESLTENIAILMDKNTDETLALDKEDVGSTANETSEIPFFNVKVNL